MNLSHIDDWTLEESALSEALTIANRVAERHAAYDSLTCGRLEIVDPMPTTTTMNHLAPLPAGTNWHQIATSFRTEELDDAACSADKAITVEIRRLQLPNGVAASWAFETPDTSDGTAAYFDGDAVASRDFMWQARYEMVLHLVDAYGISVEAAAAIEVRASLVDELLHESLELALIDRHLDADDPLWSALQEPLYPHNDRCAHWDPELIAFDWVEIDPATGDEIRVPLVVAT